MESLRESSISQIKGVEGLWISDRFAARSVSLLKELGITHVLSVTHAQDTPKFEDRDGIVGKHVEIVDDPVEDILLHLNETCDWIDAVLKPIESTDQSLSTNVEGENKKAGGVLVHCTQGISRSGAVVVAYVMRTLSLTYSSALGLVCESRPQVLPNLGFEKQLRIWGFCKYDIYCARTGSKAGEAAGGERVEKPAYKAWKRERDALLGRGEEAVNRERAKGMARVAAAFAKRRVEVKREDDGREKGWEKVEEMERMWNRRLMIGEAIGGEGNDKGDGGRATGEEKK
ncbi:phosphatases II [Lepidopterella palustris CBS 459.81]|uniref:protein-tyrosine-phosphatase n=1 Tax=Lepidopterella palustris CBS 459.81 TaxID=1314670 RepID=A0A8E2JD59_9PEZI|nr:phosphatases II [Lepidopterella palustris CBS 459.81]